MIRYILVLMSIFLFNSCSGNHQERMEELDSVYGVCDNPARNYKKGTKKYELCKDKERAEGESFFGLDGNLSDIISGEMIK